MIDSHCHLNHPRLDQDLDIVIEAAIKAGVSGMLVPGFDLESSRRAVELADRYPRLVAAVGIHPHDAKTADREALAELRALAAHDKVVAIGEIGLDFYRELSPRELQNQAFAAQIQLAGELGLPIIIHHRDAGDSTSEVFRRENAAALGGVWHCFSGDQALANFVVSSGFMLGIAGPVTFKNSRGLAELVPHIPPGNLLIETDAPYLAPHPHRGERNCPAFLPLIANKVAQIRQESIGELSENTTANFERVFGKLGLS